ncbi:unnamed protein product [Camellia sinensis]
MKSMEDLKARCCLIGLRIINVWKNFIAILQGNPPRYNKNEGRRISTTVLQAYTPPCIAPSFFRKARQRTSYEMIKLRVGAIITSQSVPGQNVVLVRPRTLGQTSLKEHNGLVPMEGDEEIFEEEAICKFCFDILKEENILKTECKCGNALIHEECAANWSRMRGNNYCDSCEQAVQTFPVALIGWLSSSTQMVDREESNKWSLFSWLMRIWKA